MHILFVSNLYPPNSIGGYEKLAFAVAQELSSRGHQITVLTSDFGGETAAYPGQTVYRDLKLFVGSSIYDPFDGSEEDMQLQRAANSARLADLVARIKPDVVFSWNLFFLHPSMLSTLETLPVPVVVMLTDNWLINMVKPEWWQDYFVREVRACTTPHAEPLPSQPVLSFKRRLAAILQRVRSGSRTDVPSVTKAEPRKLTAIFGSNYMRRMHARAGLSFRNEETVHNGVKPLQSGDAVLQHRPDRPSNEAIRLLFAGRLVDLKGAHHVVEALAHLKRTDAATMTLTIVGDRQDRSYDRTLASAIEASGCGDVISLRPPVKEHELPALFAAHDIYVFPSLYEPFSLTLIHALGEGIPTIASDAGGNTEIVVDGVTGLVYPRGDSNALADRIARLAREPELRHRLARAGKEAATRFTFDTMVDRMERVLKGIR